MIKTTTILFALLASTSAVSASPRPAFVQVDGVWQRSPDGCGTPQVAAVDPFKLPPAPAVGLRTIFLNRFGGVYKSGALTDASTNVSQLVEGAMTTIPPMNTSIFNWTTISACVKAHFRPYNVRIVETEPNAGTFIEAVVGGDGTELGFGPNQLFGIASADNFCNVTERGIAFNFSDTHAQVPRRDEELCATIAHEVGHLIALEHEQLPQDLLSYVLIADSGTKAFVDQSSGCGVSPDQPQGCSCGGATTNSHGRLQQFIGLRDTETVPPTLDVTSPGGTEVPPAFDVVATVTDNALMSDLVVLIDDAEIGNDFAPEGNVYTVAARGIPEGNHMLSVIATDAAGNAAREDIAIVVKKSATGESCTLNEACTGGLCATTEDGGFCTQTCDPAASSCPADFECSAASGQNICVPADGGGCCSSSSHPGAAFLFAFGVGALVFRRRRRR